MFRSTCAHRRELTWQEHREAHQNAVNRAVPCGQREIWDNSDELILSKEFYLHLRNSRLADLCCSASETGLCQAGLHAHTSSGLCCRSDSWNAMHLNAAALVGRQARLNQGHAQLLSAARISNCCVRTAAEAGGRDRALLWMRKIRSGISLTDVHGEVQRHKSGAWPLLTHAGGKAQRFCSCFKQR